MSIALARVDNRLVHGQVLEGWVPRLGIEVLVVADRDLAHDPLQRAVIEGLAAPGLEIRVLPPEELSRRLGEEYAGRRVLAVFRGVDEAVAAFRAGVEFRTLNLGNLNPGAEGRTISASVTLTEQDLELLGELVRSGVGVEVQAVPWEGAREITGLAGGAA